MAKPNPKRWAKTPCEVGFDQRLSIDHLRIYIAMASSVPRGEKVSKIGQRLIGDLVNLSAMTVGRRQEELISFGHLKHVERKNGQRGWYTMLSQAFEVAVPKYETKRKSAVISAAASWARIQDERNSA